MGNIDNKIEIRNVTKNKDDKTLKSVDKLQNKWVQSIKSGYCVHDVKITDPCDICIAALHHQTLKRTSPKLAQKNKIKNKKTIHEVPEETIRKNSIHNDAKTSKVKEEAEVLEKVETQTNLKENFELSLEETKTNDLKNANSAHTSGIIDEKRENQEVENTNQLTKENVEKEFSAPKSEPEISINLKEKESTTKYDDKIKIQGKMDEIKESDSFHKDDSKKKKDSKSRKRTQEFKPNELDALR